MDISFFTTAIYAVLSGTVNTPFTKDDLKRTCELRKHLNRLGFKTYVAMGSYLGNLEPSIFVLFDQGKDTQRQLNTVLETAYAFNQRQIFFANKGVFTAPFVDTVRESYSARNEMVFGTEAMMKDGYTEVVTNEGNVIFSIPDLYENERDVQSHSVVAVAESLFAVV